MTNLQIRLASTTDIQFMYEVLGSLRGEVNISFERFKKYMKNKLELENVKFLLLHSDNINLGLITLNKFEIPRYVGYGYEMEEVAIAESHKGKGYAGKFVEMVIVECAKEPNCRKVIVKTDGAVAKKLYSKQLEKIETTVFQKYLNKV